MWCQDNNHWTDDSIKFKGSTQQNVTAPQSICVVSSSESPDDQKNKDLTAFAFEHSLSSSHPSHEGNNLKPKSSSNYEGESGSHSWWPSTSFRLQNITSPNLLLGLIFNFLGVFVVIKETKKKQKKNPCHSSAVWVFKTPAGQWGVFRDWSHTFSLIASTFVAIKWSRSHSNQSEIRFRLRHLATRPPRSGSLLCHERSKGLRRDTLWLPLLIQGTWHLSVQQRPKTFQPIRSLGWLFSSCSTVTQFGWFFCASQWPKNLSKPLQFNTVFKTHVVTLSSSTC